MSPGCNWGWATLGEERKRQKRARKASDLLCNSIFHCKMCSWNRSKVVTIRPWMALGKVRSCPVQRWSHCLRRRAEERPVLREKRLIQLKISELEGEIHGAPRGVLSTKKWGGKTSPQLSTAFPLLLGHRNIILIIFRRFPIFAGDRDAANQGGTGLGNSQCQGQLKMMTKLIFP